MRIGRSIGRFHWFYIVEAIYISTLIGVIAAADAGVVDRQTAVSLDVEVVQW